MTGEEFPSQFLIGASTAAHQVEGGNVNNQWWALEHVPGLLEEPSGDAADSYHRWSEDLDLVAALGLEAYRFSLEWSRIEPAEGEFSRAALQHYERMVLGAVDRGIEPIVTLHHFTDPLWFSHEGDGRGPPRWIGSSASPKPWPRSSNRSAGSSPSTSRTWWPA